MASATFTSTTGGPGATFLDGNSMDYASGNGGYLYDLLPGTPNWEIIPENAPGVNGQGSSNYGYRGWLIGMVVEYIGAGEGGVATLVNADQAALAGSLNTLVTNLGQTYQACKLVSFEPVDRQPRPAAGSNYRQKFRVIVNAWRNS
jgi:hypothetical protein